MIGEEMVVFLHTFINSDRLNSRFRQYKSITGGWFFVHLKMPSQNVKLIWQAGTAFKIRVRKLKAGVITLGMYSSFVFFKNLGIIWLKYFQFFINFKIQKERWWVSLAYDGSKACINPEYNSVSVWRYDNKLQLLHPNFWKVESVNITQQLLFMLWHEICNNLTNDSNCFR